MKYKKKNIVRLLFFVTIIIVGKWFIGGNYLSYDSSNPLVNHRASFTSVMYEFNPIPDHYVNQKLSKKYDRILLPATSQHYQYLDPEIKKQMRPLEKGKTFLIVNTVHKKIYGVLRRVFGAESFYYILQDDKDNQYLLSEYDSFQKIH